MSKVSKEYDVQSPAEIIRDYTCFNGWYSKANRGFYYFNNLSFLGVYSYMQNHEGPFEWVNAFSERIFRHLIPLRMDALTQYNLRSIFQTVLFNLLDLEEDRSMRKLCTSYADWYFANFSKFHLDAKMFGFNFNLTKAIHFLYNFTTMDWSTFDSDEQVY
jgi:hypothetical protein